VGYMYLLCGSTKIRSERVVNQSPNWGAFARRIAPSVAILAGAGLLAMVMMGAAQPAAAQQGFGNFFGYQTQSNAKRRKVKRTKRTAPDQETKEARDKKKNEETKTSGAVYAVISIGDQHISVYDSTGRIARSSVSTGMSGHRTPTGVFSVIGRARHHYSNLYGGAPMPWMQRITWSGVAMHAGVVPGYPASHGCIRLPYSFAPKMWRLTNMHSRVIIAPRDTTPVPISHPLLPKPTMQPVPAMADASRQAAGAPAAQVEFASMSAPAHVPVATHTDESQPAGADSTKPLDPIAYAAVLKARATAEKAAAEQAEKVALQAAQVAGAEAREAVADVRKAESELEAAQARLAALEAAAAAPSSASEAAKGTKKASKGAKKDSSAEDEAAKAAREAKAAQDAAAARVAAQSELARAEDALDEARRREAIRNPAAFAAVQTWKAAVAARETAEQTLSEASRRSEPVSVLISRKEGRVFIRQDWKEVYEAPVTIRDPERPLGTHVYIAVDAKSDGSAMRWMSISVPENSKDAKPRKSVKGAKRKTEDPHVTEAAADKKPETAIGALERIELPPGVRERISELLWTGASLIVSDHARSGEMGEYTDFIVLTR
jgi:lipoprotein-anchoring transpeptidase ErfK/SrfK